MDEECLRESRVILIRANRTLILGRSVLSDRTLAPFFALKTEFGKE